MENKRWAVTVEESSKRTVYVHAAYHGEAIYIAGLEFGKRAAIAKTDRYVSAAEVKPEEEADECKPTS